MDENLNDPSSLPDELVWLVTAAFMDRMPRRSFMSLMERPAAT